MVAPPLTITDDEIAELLQRTARAVDGLHAQLTAERLL
jgi:adenosylmethionine-8-amino-7-oxononanoate aminotransferase